MKYQGVPALLKALTGGQKEMVSKMRQQGKTEAADKIEKGILAQPVKKEDQGPGKHGKKYDRLRKKMKKLDDKYFDVSDPNRSEKKSERILDRSERVRDRAVKARRKNAKENKNS